MRPLLTKETPVALTTSTSSLLLKEKPMESRTTRLKLWEIPAAYHCIILGTCLSLKATRRVLKKVGVMDLEKATDYKVHCTAIDLASRAGIPAKLLDKELERTHRKYWMVYKRLSTVKELRTQWLKDSKAGHIDGPFWCIFHHPLTDEDLGKECFGTVHMLSHQVGCSHRKKLKHHDELCNHLRKQEQKASDNEKNHLTKLRQLEEKIEEREQKLLQQEQQIVMWRNRAEAYDPADIHRLEIECDRLKCALMRSERSLEQAQQTTEILRNQLSDKNSSKQKPQTEPLKYGGETIPQPTKAFPETKCALCNLEGRTVLYVGGEKGMIQHLRRITRDANGQFLHHDGGIENSVRSLSKLCARADAVLCPINKVGHDAINHVKRSCTSTQKPFVPLKRSSLDAYFRGLNNLVLGETPPNQYNKVNES